MNVAGLVHRPTGSATGALGGVVAAAPDRAGAVVFEELTGSWPGN